MPHQHAAKQRDFRSRHRARRHAEAHDDGPAKKRKIPDHPLIPTGKPTLVTTDDGLSALLQRLTDAGSFAYDTEFIGETTYHPQLCVVQVATVEEVALIDPLSVPSLDGLWHLLADPAVRKLVHAGEQDLEPIVRHINKPPANVFDTQLAAGFAAMSWPSALSKLAAELAGVKLPKGFTFTDWSERPLSQRQLDYAADDVRYLPRITAVLDEKLAELGHAEWAAAACEEQCAMDRYVYSLDDAVRRVKGGGNVEPPQRPVLRALVEWRDAAAREADLPPRALLKDEILVHLARKKKLTANELGGIKHFPRPLAARVGNDIVAAWQAGHDAPKGDTTPIGPPLMPDPSEKFAAEGLHAAFAALCHSRGLDPGLLANRTDVVNLALRHQKGQDVSDHPLFTTWRANAVGDAVKQLLGGQPVELSWSPA